MSAYLANTLNKIDSSDIRDAIPYRSEWQGVKNAQAILKTYTSKCSKDDWADLASKIFNSVLRAEIENKVHLEMAVQTIMEWSYKVSLQSLDPIRSRRRVYNFANNQKLSSWQVDLLRSITILPYISKIFIFEKHGVSYFWVISQNPSTEMIMKYSKEYINILQKTPDLNIDFMVFGEEEISYYQFPKEAFIFYNEG